MRFYKLTFSDWLSALVWLVMAILMVGSRWIVKSQYLLHQDSVQFALALNHWDIIQHQPHPPGYIFYIGLGKLASLITADQNLALIIINIAASIFGLWGIGWLAYQWWGRSGSIIAGLIYITNASVWFHGSVAEVYIVEASVAIWVIAFAYKYWKKGRMLDLIWLGLLMGVLGGIRQSGEMTLLPLVGYVVWSKNKFQWRTWRLFIGTLLISNMAWIIPLLYFSGGIANYWIALSNLLSHTVIDYYRVNQFSGIVKNLSLLIETIKQSSPIGMAILGLGVLPYFAMESRDAFRIKRHNLVFWFWALFPMLAMLILVGITNPGYALVVILVLCLFLSGAIISINAVIGRWQPQLKVLFTGIAIIILIGAQTWSFFKSPISQLTFGSASVNTISDIDKQIASLQEVIGKKPFTEENTIICVDGATTFPSLRHFQYYLPTLSVYGVYRAPWNQVKNPNDLFIYAHGKDKLISAHQIKVGPNITKILLMNNDLFPEMNKYIKSEQFSPKELWLLYFDITDLATKTALIDSGLFHFTEAQ